MLALLARPATVGAQSAQANGSVAVTGTVLQAITITGTDLKFGNMLATQTRTVAPASASAGRFILTMAANTSVTISYVLPTSLGTGITIGSWQALYNEVNSTGSAIAVPIGATTGSYAASTSTGQMYVWLGATLTTAGAAPGSYGAPVRLTVSYN